MMDRISCSTLWICSFSCSSSFSFSFPCYYHKRLKTGFCFSLITCLATLFNLSRSHLLMVNWGSPTLLSNNSGQRLWDFSPSRPRAQCLTGIISFTSWKSCEEYIIIIRTLQMSQIMFVSSHFFLSCPLSDLNMGIRAEIVYLCFLDETDNSRSLIWLNLSRKGVKTIGKVVTPSRYCHFGMSQIFHVQNRGFIF